MKALFLLMLTLGVSLHANAAQKAAQKLHYYNAYAKAKEIAQKEHKNLMLLVVQDGCHWCKKFERTTLSKEDVKKEIEPFVKVVVDRYDPMPQKFQTRFFPVVFFVDPDGDKILNRSLGYRTKELFLEDIQEALKKGDLQ